MLRAARAQMLPATVQELNLQENLKDPALLLKKTTFEDIQVEKRLKREVSLPTGVENWNIGNYDSYLNFEDYDVLTSSEDRIVPQVESRERCGSQSSIASSLEEKPIFLNFGVKTINTVRMDSGSTCISSDHSYYNSGSVLYKCLDPEETYQNLDIFLQEVPEMNTVEPIETTRSDVVSSPFSPLASTSSNDSSFELTVLKNIKTFSQGFEDGFAEAGTSTKRPFSTISDDDVFVVKQVKHEVTETASSVRYQNTRKKNNVASKNCRKTRKEKQKEMEQRVSELEQEREHLNVQVKVLEELIQAHKQCLLNAIAQKR